MLRKSKEGFTLIELMVVVVIIGVLAVLGLRAYSGQIEKAKNAVVKANAGTVQTLIQGELADTPGLPEAEAVALGLDAGLQNPFDSSATAVQRGVATDIEGVVEVSLVDNVFTVTGIGSEIKTVIILTASR